MAWQQEIYSYVGQPVGISLVNGQGVSGVLCQIGNGRLYVLEYLYQSQFATKQYMFGQVQNVTVFPGCGPSQSGLLY
ncbi:hypothetical protein SY83_01030 [Paenibacillus swuensis]|uniref:Uncharacterized protein n=1 Tax=Paenibacillus swuensis TaxID=1178515 RepID=A0A172TE15_9BACL|nr:hypothetical protein [Paenibacillus swuensis]ANE45154.1 hypothetical protein SY83_01030 [Paenibacillus swuensis]